MFVVVVVVVVVATGGVSLGCSRLALAHYA